MPKKLFLFFLITFFQAQKLKQFIANFQNLENTPQIQSYQTTVYNYINCLRGRTDIIPKKKINEILSDLYNFEIEKESLLKNDFKNDIESINEIMEAELNKEIEKINGDEIAEKLRKIYIYNVSKHFQSGMELKKQYLAKLDKNAKKISSEKNVKIELVLQNFLEQKKVKFDLSTLDKHLFNITQLKVIKHINLKFKEKIEFFQIKIDSKKFISEILENLGGKMKEIDEFRQKVVFYNELRKNPIFNMKNMIEDFIKTLNSSYFIIDRENFEINLGKILDFVSAFRILNEKIRNLENLKKGDSEFERNLEIENLGKDLLGFVKIILENEEREYNEEKKNFKLIVGKKILGVLMDLGFEKMAFDFVIEFFQNKFPEELNEDLKLIILRNYQKNFDLKKIENQFHILDLINQVATKEIHFFEKNEKMNIINNFDLLAKLFKQKEKNNYFFKFSEELKELTNLTDEKEVEDDLYKKINKFKNSENNNDLARGFDLFLNDKNLEEKDYYILYKLNIAKNLEGTDYEIYFNGENIQILEKIQTMISTSQKLNNILIGLLNSKNLIQTKTEKYKNYPNLLKNEKFSLKKKFIKKIPTKNDESSKKQIADFINSNPEVYKQKQKKINTDLSEEIEEKNFVNFIYGDKEPQLNRILEDSEGVKAIAAKVEVIERGNGFRVERVYIYVQRRKSPCFEDNC